MTDLEKFIKLYNSGIPLQEVADKTGLRYSEVRNLAASLRKLGITIERHQAGRKTNG